MKREHAVLVALFALLCAAVPFAMMMTAPSKWKTGEVEEEITDRGLQLFLSGLRFIINELIQVLSSAFRDVVDIIDMITVVPIKVLRGIFNIIACVMIAPFITIGL